MIEELDFPGYFLVVYDIVDVLPGAATSTARGGGRRPTRRSATRSASPMWTRSSTTCSSSGSWRRSGTGRRTSTSTSSRTAARRSSSTSTRSTAGEHTAQVANVISYRPRSAVRDMAKAFGFSPGQQDAWSKQIDRWGERRHGRRRRHPGAGGGVRQRVADLPPPPGHPLRRHGDLRPAGHRGVPGRVGADAGPHRAAVGQGRLRRDQPGQVRPARAWACCPRCTTRST